MTLALASPTSPDTDRRFFELVLARGAADGESVRLVAVERDRRAQLGERVASLPRALCEAGLLAPEYATQLLLEVRRQKRGSQAERRVGPYAVIDVIGRGGMGVVLRGRHPTLPREVAIKMIRADALGDDEAVARFRAEVVALARIEHPNVIPVLDAGRAEDGSPYYVMPLVKGRSLGDELKADGPLDPERAASLVAKVARAMHAVHERTAIVHRDLKPSNVLIEEESGEPRVFDFGLAKDSTGGSATRSGEVLGTVEYMAPEQAMGVPGAVDARTDVHGLGALLYGLLTGEPPFPTRGRPVTAVLAEVCLEDPAPPVSLRPEVPGDLDAICRQALAKEKERRYPSALALAEDLERFVAGEPVRARPPGFADRLARTARRHTITLVGVALALLLASVAAATVFARQSAALRKALAVAEESRRRDAERATVHELLELARRCEAQAGSSFLAPPAGERGERRWVGGPDFRVELLGATRRIPDGTASGEVAALVAAARAFARACDLEAARGVLNDALARSSDDEDALCLHHLIAHDLGGPVDHARYKEAANRRGRRDVVDGLDLEALTGAGVTAETRPAAREIFARTSAASTDPIVRFARGCHLETEGLTSAAMAEYSHVLSVFPDHPETLRRRAACYYRLGLLTLAEADARTALARRRDTVTLMVRSSVHVMRWEHDEAVRLAEEILAAKPEYASAVWVATLASIGARRFQEAASYAARLERLARNEPDRVEAIGMGRLARALAGETPPRTREDAAQAWSMVADAVIFARAGRREEAARELERADGIIRLRLDKVRCELVIIVHELAQQLGLKEMASRWFEVMSTFFRVEGDFPPELMRRLQRR